MPLTYQPKRRAVLYCDFRGYEAPEIIKKRPVVVLKAHKTNSRWVAVVPLSTTPPVIAEEHQVRLLRNPIPGESRETWAKCDMVAVVSTDRLDLVRSGRRRADGKREYIQLQIGPEQFEEVRRGVVAGLGLANILRRRLSADAVKTAGNSEES